MPVYSLQAYHIVSVLYFSIENAHQSPLIVRTDKVIFLAMETLGFYFRLLVVYSNMFSTCCFYFKQQENRNLDKVLT